MIPEEKMPAVTRGLREAFGVAEFDDIRMMTRGHTTALVFRIVVKGAPYLLKIIMNSHSIGAARQFGCMRAAAEAGVAPKVWYTSLEDEISITDFVEDAPFPASEALVRMPALLRKLHALEPFPGVESRLNTTCTFLLSEGQARDGFLRRFQGLQLLEKSECDALLGWHAQAAAVYRVDEADMVSSHNDLFKPDNILFDGERVWLVDWEAAFRNDRYADLAVVANFVTTNEAEEEVYLRKYFGQAPNEYQRARYYLMRQMAHMFYAMAFLLVGSLGKPVSRDEEVPDFHDFHRRMRAGEVDLSDSRMKLQYAWIHWNRLLENMRQTRFQEALRIVSA